MRHLTLMYHTITHKFLSNCWNLQTLGSPGRPPENRCCWQGGGLVSRLESCAGDLKSKIREKSLSQACWMDTSATVDFRLGCAIDHAVFMLQNIAWLMAQDLTSDSPWCFIMVLWYAHNIFREALSMISQTRDAIFVYSLENNYKSL